MGVGLLIQCYLRSARGSTETDVVKDSEETEPFSPRWIFETTYSSKGSVIKPDHQISNNAKGEWRPRAVCPSWRAGGASTTPL
ncbi:unnamed protein product [Dibothriocephalus latus]|uniref:Uncharacterized protein n=1 Tax=Dibothriocephalus latus TaxID=60516 RepID=A0A3P6UV80_DIBLA|nr:unnamed protein product [Dibothriocephalus latus]